ncbi:MAG TPA: CAP domain-containing protein [Candidatus Saccharimonadales bacterium]|nr:CAP domain-containing protein [Candidatus Saccharimonadales bacterium]
MVGTKEVPKRILKAEKAKAVSAKNKKIKKLHIVLALVALYGVVVIIAAIGSYNQTNREKSATQAKTAAEQARLAADPVNINGIYNALNKERSSTGAPALSTVSNLVTAAQQYCRNMVNDGYFDYKDPKTGKSANDFISANAGNLYLKTYVASIFSVDPKADTSTDAVNLAVKNQATNLNNPSI